MGSAALELPLPGLMAPGVVRGLQVLAGGPPLWPEDLVTWPMVVASVKAFAERWDGEARACGWPALSLYGLHRRAPWANLAAMGAAFVLARVGSRASAINGCAIETGSATGMPLRVYRTEPEPAAVLAWELRRHGLQS